MESLSRRRQVVFRVPHCCAKRDENREECYQLSRLFCFDCIIVIKPDERAEILDPFDYIR